MKTRVSKLVEERLFVQIDPGIFVVQKKLRPPTMDGCTHSWKTPRRPAYMDAIVDGSPCLRVERAVSCNGENASITTIEICQKSWLNEIGSSCKRRSGWKCMTFSSVMLQCMQSSCSGRSTRNEANVIYIGE